MDKPTSPVAPEQVVAAPLNGIKATPFHDEGAIAQCFYCKRYTMDIEALNDRPMACECGKKNGWSGSFRTPGPNAKWSGIAPDTLDVCTDSDNCNRCKTHPKHRGSIDHAGIPVGKSYGAKPSEVEYDRLKKQKDLILLREQMKHCKCDECGHSKAEGLALYCASCAEKFFVASPEAAPAAIQRIDSIEFTKIAARHLPGDMGPHNAWLFFQEASRVFFGKEIA